MLPLRLRVHRGRYESGFAVPLQIQGSLPLSKRSFRSVIVQSHLDLWTILGTSPLLQGRIAAPYLAVSVLSDDFAEVQCLAFSLLEGRTWFSAIVNLHIQSAINRFSTFA